MFIGCFRKITGKFHSKYLSIFAKSSWMPENKED